MKHTYTPVRVNGVSDGEYQFLFELVPDVLELPEQFSNPVHVRVDMEKRNTQVLLTVAAETTAEYSCDRCLEPLSVPVKARFRLFYVRDTETAHITNEEKEVKNLDPNEPVIDITADAVDSLLVNVPMRKVCEDFNPANTSCSERIETQADAEDGGSIDPRWEALKKLKDDDN